MGTPTNRTPLRVARGTTSALNTGLSDIQEGEIVWDTTLNRLQVKEGSALENSTAASDATKAPLASPTFTGTVAIPNIANVETAITGKQAADADLTALSSCQTGAATALALLTATEVGVLDGVTSTTAELNILDGVTSTATELNLLDGKTAVGDALLAADQSWTGAQSGAITSLGTYNNSTAMNLGQGNNYSLDLNENSTLAQPSNYGVGQSGSIFVKQDATGSRTLAYHTDWKWVGGTAPTLTTTAAAVARIDYIVAAANKIHAAASLDVK